MVTHIKRVFRDKFRELPSGAPYWIAGTLATAPSMKHRRRAKITGYSATTAALTTSAVDASSSVVKLPGASGSFGSGGYGNIINPSPPETPS